MRIEYQGHVQNQTYYTHVGYLSSGLRGVNDVRTDPLSGVCLGAVILLLLLSVTSVRRLRTKWRWPLAALLVIAAIGSGALAYSKSRQVVLTPDYYLTIYRIERLSALTDGWIERNGRPPTVSEWNAMCPAEEREAGRGKSLRYALLRKDEWLSAAATQPSLQATITRAGYVIWWPVHGTVDWPAGGELTNWHAGSDGLFGTRDDARSLRLAFRQKQLAPPKYAHGRTPREGGHFNAH